MEKLSDLLFIRIYFEGCIKDVVCVLWEVIFEVQTKTKLANLRRICKRIHTTQKQSLLSQDPGE